MFLGGRGRNDFSEFQVSWGYTVRPCLKNKNRNTNTKARRPREDA